MSVSVSVSFPIPAIRLWGSIALPPSCTTGASGVPAASFARRGLTARVGLCWAYVGPMLAYVGPMLSHLGGYVGDMLAILGLC